MAPKRPVPKLASIDDLLLLSEQPGESSDQKGGMQTVPINKIRFFKDHPFRLYDGERLTDMANSIESNGVLVPVIIRRIETDVLQRSFSEMLPSETWIFQTVHNLGLKSKRDWMKSKNGNVGSSD